MSKYTIGLDFGTNSCRSLIVDITNGDEIASHVYDYPSGTAGVVCDDSDPNLARQNPHDYLKGIEVCITKSLQKARDCQPHFTNENIIGIGVDTTGSSPMPVDTAGTPLCFDRRFKNNHHAMVWLPQNCPRCF
jgi:L-ribulokinase